MFYTIYIWRICAFLDGFKFEIQKCEHGLEYLELVLKQPLFERNRFNKRNDCVSHYKHKYILNRLT